MRRFGTDLAQLVLDFLAEPTSAPQPIPMPPPAGAASLPTAMDAVPKPEAVAPAGGAADNQAHPQANRHACLQGIPVAYRFERSRRKSIGLTVGPEGLVVRAPSWVPLREVDATLQEKAAWILRKLQLMRERAAVPALSEPVWGHGADLPYLGRTLRLCVGRPSADPAWPPEVDVLPLQLPPQASPTQVREAAEAWFKKQARALFEQRLQHFAPLLGVRCQRLSLSSARTRWGSARSDGHIRLNWRLIHLPLAQIDYVVVHELAHLRVMDHSPRFWDTVAEVLPDYRERRRRLRGQAV